MIAGMKVAAVGAKTGEALAPKLCHSSKCNIVSRFHALRALFLCSMQSFASIPRREEIEMLDEREMMKGEADANKQRYWSTRLFQTRCISMMSSLLTIKQASKRAPFC